MRKSVCLGMALLMLMLSGCSSLFSHSYHSERAFQGNQALDLNANVQVVQNYSQLRRLVFSMMNNHEESAELLFSGYTGNVVSDITSVCNALKTESAYGAYCVEYGSYDLTQIVSYYEATITISYLYSAEELAGMLNTTNMDSFGDVLAEELAKETESFVVKINNGAGDQDTVNAFVTETLRAYPMAVSYEPKVSVKIYNGNSSQKIYEVSVQYDDAVDNKQRLKEMSEAMARALDNGGEAEPAEAVAAAAMYLAEHCDYSEAGGSLAYDAWTAETANSEGLACAMQGLCQQLGVESMVVSGRENRLDHYWNIVKLGDDYYHVDVSTVNRLGAEESLFLRDEEKGTDFWWDQSVYPYCDGSLMYGDIFSEKIKIKA